MSDDDIALGDAPDDSLTEPEPGGPETDGMAIAGLACALAGFVVPIVPSVAALYLAAASELRLEAAAGELGGAGLNQASRILAWLGMSLWVLGMLFVLAGIAGRVVSS